MRPSFVDGDGRAGTHRQELSAVDEPSRVQFLRKAGLEHAAVNSCRNCPVITYPLGIPSSTLEVLNEIPKDRPVALLLRHAERAAISPDDVGNDVPITQNGSTTAHELGAYLKGRLKTLRTSPVLRCVQTAEWIRHGAEGELEICHDRFLGDPGIFVENPELAWTNWQTMGNEGVMHHMANSDRALPGMAHPEKAARQLVSHMLEVAKEEPGLHVFVTHDVLLSATAARMLGAEASNPCPQFLEVAGFWYDTSALIAVYRSHKRRL